MTPSPTAEPTPTDTNNPFTRNLLRSLAGTVRAQPDETEAEYAERFAAATAAWAAFFPRDPVEQLLAAQIVSASYAALDCLNKAAETEDPAQADRLRRSFATMNRTMRDTLRLLNIQQKRPVASAAAALAIEPSPPRRRPAAPNPPQQPMHREKPRSGRAAAADPLDKDPAKMSDAELDAAIEEMKARRIAALADPEHPLHREVSALPPHAFRP
jgi:DNA primase